MSHVLLQNIWYVLKQNTLLLKFENTKHFFENTLYVLMLIIIACILSL